jgi:ADP-heptose:LPS heptosyltransferase
MKTLIISPYSRKLRNGKKNAKDYPWWQEIIDELKKRHNDIKIIQIGVSGEEKLKNIDECLFDLSLKDLKELILSSDIFLSIDNFFHHYIHYLGKQNIVIWGQSDPILFGYKEDINLLKDKKYLRKEQFSIWEECEFNKDAWIDPNIVVNSILKLLDN